MRIVDALYVLDREGNGDTPGAASVDGDRKVLRFDISCPFGRVRIDLERHRQRLTPQARTFGVGFVQRDHHPAGDRIELDRGTHPQAIVGAVVEDDLVAAVAGTELVVVAFTVEVVAVALGAPDPLGGRIVGGAGHAAREDRRWGCDGRRRDRHERGRVNRRGRRHWRRRVGRPGRGGRRGVGRHGRRCLSAAAAARSQQAHADDQRGARDASGPAADHHHR